jgi:hypothetical protein
MDDSNLLTWIDKCPKCGKSLFWFGAVPSGLKQLFKRKQAKYHCYKCKQPLLYDIKIIRKEINKLIVPYLIIVFVIIGGGYFIRDINPIISFASVILCFIYWLYLLLRTFTKTKCFSIVENDKF